MEKNPITFSVKMTAKEVYRFTLYHVYHSASGLIGITLSLVAIVYLLLDFSHMSDLNRTITIIIALWFTVWEPVMMFSRSKAQVKRNKVYQKPLNYRIDENGIEVSQDEECQVIEWGKLLKIVETKTQFLVYSSRIHSFIFPKSLMDGQEQKLQELIVMYTDGTSVQLKGRLRKLRRNTKS